MEPYAGYNGCFGYKGTASCTCPKKLFSVFIEDDGSVTFLQSPLTAGFNLGPSLTRKYSAVEPDCWYLRLVFHMLRLLFGEASAVSDYTRNWPCLWRARIKGGPILRGRWYARQQAIDAEIKFFNENGVQQ